MTERPSKDVAAARAAWARLAELGGFVTRPDLQQRWALTQQRIQKITTTTGFPAPRSPGRNALWLTADVEQWRRWNQTRPGRPGPRSAALVPLLEDDDLDLQTADKAWAALENAGGLIGTRELAARWGITQRGVAERAARPDFPEPIAPQRWLTADVEQWHQRHH